MSTLIAIIVGVVILIAAWNILKLLWALLPLIIIVGLAVYFVHRQTKKATKS
ncbi:hypothetical protein HYT92_01005 [Candidatus Pacearchaeota archaeon]|nr:hypothetical protein [Candidatus Pacearchaeota archaeon]